MRQPQTSLQRLSSKRFGEALSWHPTLAVFFVCLVPPCVWAHVYARRMLSLWRLQNLIRSMEEETVRLSRHLDDADALKQV